MTNGELHLTLCIYKIKQMKKLILLLLIMLTALTCKKESQLEKKIANIPIDITFERFDRQFAKSSQENLPELKRKFPFMFSKQFSDSIWVAQIRDTIQQELFCEVEKQFSTTDAIEGDVHQFYKHLKYYFPEISIPRLITTTSYVDYRNKVIVTDTIVLISLDTYLGSDHYFYDGIQKYLRQNFNKEQIVVDLATEYSKSLIYQTDKRTLLDEMVSAGKQLYFKDKMIPFKSDAEKIGYTQDQLDWAIVNESYIWRYFVDRELLYSTDSKLPGRFINPAPYSKFYLEEIDSESPGRLGQYMGWQIVRAYMNNNDVTIKQLLNANTDDIFNNSKFKPRK